MSLKIIKFGAVWCGPCRMLQPLWDQLVDDIHDVEFVSIDIDKEPELAKQYHVSAVPTMLFIKDDKVVDSMIGLHKEVDIRNKIDLVKRG